MILPDCINEVLLKERSRFKSASMFFHYSPCLRVFVYGVPGSRWWVLIAISAAKTHSSLVDSGVEKSEGSWKGVSKMSCDAVGFHHEFVYLHNLALHNQVQIINENSLCRCVAWWHLEFLEEFQGNRCNQTAYTAWNRFTNTQWPACLQVKGESSQMTTVA